MLIMGERTIPSTTATLLNIPSSCASSILKKIRTTIAPRKNKLQIKANRDKKEKPVIHPYILGEQIGFYTKYNQSLSNEPKEAKMKEFFL